MPEVEEALANAQKMMDKINEKKKQFDETIGKAQDELDKLEEKYIGRSKQFIESKREELTAQLEEKKKIVQEEIDKLTKTAQDWMDKKVEELTKKFAEKTLKILTGINNMIS